MFAALKAKRFSAFDRILRRERRSSSSDVDRPRCTMGQYLSGGGGRKKAHSESERDESPKVSRPIANPNSTTFIHKYAEKMIRERGVIPDSFLVHDHPSSEFIDEDGDVANEFYTESIGEKGKRRLCKIVKNIRPKGRDRYQIPRLNPDLPVVMWELQK